jgi:hypothetical protein
MASLLLGLIAMLAVVCVRSVVMNISMQQADAAVYLGIESVFSEYLRPLSDRYAVFGFACADKKQFMEKMSGYMEYNLDCEKGLPVWNATFYKIKQTDMKDTELVYLTDRGGAVFAKQVTDYMKYAAPAGLVKEWSSPVTSVGDNKTAEQVHDEYLEVVEYAAKIDEKVMEIVENIDAVRANSIAERLKKLDTELILIHAAYYSADTMGVIKDAGFYRILGEITSETQRVANSLSQIEKDVEEIRQLCEKLADKAAAAQQSLETKKEKLSKELYEAYLKGYEEFENYGNQIHVINLTALPEAVNQNLPVIQEFSGIKEMEKIKLSINNLTNASAQIHQWEAVMQKLDYTALSHTYEGTQYSFSQGMRSLKKIKKLLTEGVLSVVIPEGKAVSGKYVTYTDLASDTAQIENDQNDADIAEDILFNEYVIEQFLCFTSQNTDISASLEYGVEYIICGNRKDSDNLCATAEKLVLLRNGFNLAYLMGDSGKKAEAYALSAAVLAVTGCEGIVKLGQCLVLSAWAYGESLNDVKILLDSGKVPLVKTSTAWNTTLNDILSMNFAGKSECEEGLDYGGYLRILLYLCGREKKYYRTMDMIEIGMEDAGYSDVRLSKLVSQASGVVKMQFSGMKYEKKFQYGY